MNKTIVLQIILLSIFLNSVSAFQSFDGPLIDDNDTIGFSIEPSLGYFYGDVREIVYYDAKGTYLSELLWDMSNLFYIGVSASINIINRLYVNAGLWHSINPGNGFMEDFDWLNLKANNYPINNDHNRNGWTNWSLSTVDIVDSYFFDFNYSFDFLDERKHSLTFFLGYKSFYWDWSDIVQNYTYSYSVPDPIGKNSIDYQLTLNIPYLGMGYSYYFNLFFISFRSIYSPIVSANDHDHHILTGMHYYDSVSSGHYLGLSLKSGYKLNTYFMLSGQIDFDYMFEARGNTKIYNESGFLTGNILGGAGIQYQSISISIKATFNF